MVMSRRLGKVFGGAEPKLGDGAKKNKDAAQKNKTKIIDVLSLIELRSREKNFPQKKALALISPTSSTSLILPQGRRLRKSPQSRTYLMLAEIGYSHALSFYKASLEG